MKAWEIMSTNIVKISKNTPLTKAREMFRKYENRIAAIYDVIPDGKYLGFINRRDIITLTSSKSDRTVKDLIRELPKIYKDTEIEDIITLLKSHEIYACPVLDSLTNEEIIGIVSYRQIIKALKSSGFIPKAKTAGEVMSTEIDRFILSQNERITKAWPRFVYRNIPGLVIIKDEDLPKPVGILTPKDLIETGKWYFRRENERIVTTPAKIKSIMKRGVIVAHLNTPIEVLADFIIKYDFSLIPVVDSKGMLIGIVTQEDITKGYIEGRKPGRKPIKVAPLPLPITKEEKPVYLSRTEILNQVLILKKEKRKTNITVADILKPSIPAIRVKDTIEYARNIMLKNKVNEILVLDDDGKILGSISKRRLLYALGIRGPFWRRRPFEKEFIWEVLNKNVPIIRNNTSIEKAARIMVLNGCDVLLVVDNKGLFKGVITKDNLVKSLLNVKNLNINVEHIITPYKISIVHPDHSLAHAVRKMKAYYLDALAVYNGNRILGVLSENRLPFIALEDAKTGIKSKRLIWIRKLVKGGRKQGRYIKITPLLVRDALTPIYDTINLTTNIKEAIKLMLKNNVDGIPVVDNKKNLIGIVCKLDIIRELARTGPEKIITEKKEVKLDV